MNLNLKQQHQVFFTFQNKYLRISISLMYLFPQFFSSLRIDLIKQLHIHVGETTVRVFCTFITHKYYACQNTRELV